MLIMLSAPEELPPADIEAGSQRLEYSTAAQATILAKLVASCKHYIF